MKTTTIKLKYDDMCTGMDETWPCPSPLNVNDYLLVWDTSLAQKEAVRITAVNDDTITVVRGLLGTQHIAHSIDAKVIHEHSFCNQFDCCGQYIL